MLFLSLLFASVLLNSEQDLCPGFLPENSLRVPARIFQTGGVTQSDFDFVLDEVERHYAPVVTAKGARLQVTRKWESEIVNASASRVGSTYIIRIYGGLARYPSITKDGFMLVACHEMGHHLGGAPKWQGDDWASNEGGADYYATLRCLRHLFTPDDTRRFVETQMIDSHLRTKCEEAYATQEEENFCMRSGMAGLSTAKLFQEVRQVVDVPRFDTPDTSIVDATFDDHPMPQCRLDTYLQGALCMHDTSVELSETDPAMGTCNELNGQSLGVRPRCWFMPLRSQGELHHATSAHPPAAGRRHPSIAVP